MAKDKKWYIVPRKIIDRSKYKGRGRPKKTDYRIFPGKQDLGEPIMRVKSIRKLKNGDYRMRASIGPIKPEELLPKGFVMSEGTNQ